MKLIEQIYFHKVSEALSAGGGTPESFWYTRLTLGGAGIE